MCEAMRKVLGGEVYVSENVSRRMLVEVSERRRDGFGVGTLTDREFEVFNLLGLGLTTREIAQRLRLSIKTVETHRLHVRERLKLGSGAALMNYAMKWAAAQKAI